MLSVNTGASTQSVQIAQTPSSPLGATAENEEKKKKSHIPSVEVSAAQAQGFSARVGEFLSNQSSKPSNASNGASTGFGPTGADGVAPTAAAPVAVPAPAQSDNEGSSSDRESGANQDAYVAASAQLEAGNGAARTNSADRQRDDEDVLEFHEDGTYSASQQALRYAREELPPIAPAAAGTVININPQADAASDVAEEDAAFAEDQRREEEQESVEETEETRSAQPSERPDRTPSTTTVANGNFKLQFDEAGTYGFAVA